MWVFTEFGFFSIVQHRSDADTLLVRGRSRSDLVAFARRAKLPVRSVKRDTAADYEYRIAAPRSVVQGVVADALAGLDYDNFKSRVELTQGVDRERAYLEVWSALRRSIA